MGYRLRPRFAPAHPTAHLHIQILHVERVFLEKQAAGFDVVAQQHAEEFVGAASGADFTSSCWELGGAGTLCARPAKTATSFVLPLETQLEVGSAIPGFANPWAYGIVRELKV